MVWAIYGPNEVWEVDAPLGADCNPKDAGQARQSAFALHRVALRSGMASDSEYEVRMSAATPENRFSDRVIGWLVWVYMRINTSTIRWRIEGAKELAPLLAGDRPVVVATWHYGILLFPALQTKVLKRWPRQHPTTIINSNSRDGNIAAAASSFLGLHSVRGSTARKDRRKEKGGVAGARAALKAMKSGAIVCMTIDGPRGPAERVPLEPVKLAQQAGAAVVPLGLSSGGKRLNTWDRFLLPLPFSRGSIVLGAPIETDKSMGSDALRETIERHLNDAAERAALLVGRDEPRRSEAAAGAQLEAGRK